MLQASLEFDMILFLFFDDLYLQIIESIDPKASVENLSAQWAIFLTSIYFRHPFLGWTFFRHPFLSQLFQTPKPFRHLKYLDI